MALWLGDDGLAVEYGGHTLSRYDVSYAPGARRLEGVTNPKLFATRHRPAQLKLCALEEALGEGGWPNALGLSAYAARSRSRPEALQGSCSPTSTPSSGPR